MVSIHGSWGLFRRCDIDEAEAGQRTKFLRNLLLGQPEVFSQLVERDPPVLRLYLSSVAPGTCCDSAQGVRGGRTCQHRGMHPPGPDLCTLIATSRRSPQCCACAGGPGPMSGHHGGSVLQYEAFTHGSREPGPGGGRFRFKVTTTAVMSLIGLLSKVVHASATLLKERLFFGLLSKFNDGGVRTRTDSVCGFLSFFCPLDVSDSSVPAPDRKKKVSVRFHRGGGLGGL